MLDPCPDSLSHLVSRRSHRTKMLRKDKTCLRKTTGRTVATRKSLLFRAHEPGFASEPDPQQQKRATTQTCLSDAATRWDGMGRDWDAIQTHTRQKHDRQDTNMCNTSRLCISKMTMEPSIELDTSILLSTPRSSNSCVTPAVCRVTPYIFVNELTFQAVMGSLKGPPVNNVCDLHC
jgi:hypothetical protein